MAIFDGLFSSTATATKPNSTKTSSTSGKDPFASLFTSKNQETPEQHTTQTHDFNGTQIPADIPTKNLVSYDASTGNKTFKLPPQAGGGVYTEDKNGNIVKGGHTTYGDVPQKTGFERADIIPVSLGGTNSNPDNISYEPLLPKNQQKPGQLTQSDQFLDQKGGINDQVKSGQLAPKAAIAKQLSEQESHNFPNTTAPSLWDKIKGAVGDVTSGLKTGGDMLVNQTQKSLATVGIKKPSQDMNFKVGEGLSQGTGNGTSLNAKATITKENQQGQNDQALRQANNADAMQLEDIIKSGQHITRTAAALVISGYQMFQNDAENKINLQNRISGKPEIPHTDVGNSVEPVTMSPLAQKLLGTDTIKDLPGQAADLEQQLNKAGITGTTASILASLGVSADTVTTLYPFVGDGIGKASNDAVLDLAKNFEKDTGVTITRNDMYQISRGDPDGVVPTQVKQAWTEYVNKASAAKLAAKTGSVNLPNSEETALSSGLKSAATKDIFGGKPYNPTAPFATETSTPKPPEAKPFTHELTTRPFADELSPTKASVSSPSAPETTITPKSTSLKEKFNEAQTKAKTTPSETSKEPVPVYRAQEKGTTGEFYTTDKAAAEKYATLNKNPEIVEKDISNLNLKQVTSQEMLNEKENPETLKNYDGLAFKHPVTGSNDVVLFNKGNKVSGVAKSIEAKAIEQGLTEKGFDNLADFQGTTFKEQATKVADLLNSDLEKAKSIARGETDIPSDIRSGALLSGLEDIAKQTKDIQLMHDLANSPLATKISQSASEVSLTRMREKDSATLKLQEIKKAREVRAEKRSSKEITKLAKTAKAETEKINLPKEDLEWDKFLSEIQC
jgi:hypothetical protein